MKKTFIILLLVLLLSTGAYFVFRKTQGALQMSFDVGDIDLGISDWKSFYHFLTSGSQAVVDILISNYSNEHFRIDNLYAEIYSLPTTDENGKEQPGILIGYQTEPLSEAFEISDNSNNIVSIPFYFKGAMLWQIGKQLGINSISELWNIVQNYMTTGKFGTSIIVKGFAVVKGIKLPFEFEKAI